MKRIIKAALFLAMIFSVISYNSVAFSQEEEEQPMRTFNKTSLITNISKLSIMNNDKYQQWADLQNQAKNLAPNFNFDNEWKSNVTYLYEYLKNIDSIFLQLKNPKVTPTMTMSSQLQSFAFAVKSYENKVGSLNVSRLTSKTKLTISQKQTQMTNILSNICKMAKQAADSVIQNIK